MIKLSSLITLNEQGPTDAMGGSPVPLQTPPPTGAQPPEDTGATPPPSPESDNTPSPDDPGEYDWTKDFRAFEDAKNKAEAAAKKKLLDKMNKQLSGKKITVNASRGYGQPKTDYTIDKVKKISVEFWYKEWVAIITDENDKKYFLTPGVNIKIEAGADSEPQSASAPQEPEPAPTAPQGGEEQPNDTSTGAPTGAPMGEVPPAQPESQPPTDPNAAAQPQQPPTEQPEVPEEPKKKKKFAELARGVVIKDLSSFLLEFLNENIQDINISSYIKSVKSAVNESKSANVYRSKIEIPESHVVRGFDPRDLKLAAKEALWESGNVGGHFSRGSVEVSKVGRVYIVELTREAGWKS